VLDARRAPLATTTLADLLGGAAPPHAAARAPSSSGSPGGHPGHRATVGAV
jgi:hypothetical protein